MDGVKISEIPFAMVEKKEEYTDDHEQTRGSYSHTMVGTRYYELEENIGYNLGITDQGQVRLSLSREKVAKCIFEHCLSTNPHKLKWETIHPHTKNFSYGIADALIKNQKDLFVVVKEKI